MYKNVLVFLCLKYDLFSGSGKAFLFARFLLVFSFRKGVKKHNSCVNGGGGRAAPPVRNQLGFFLKKKKMKNALKRKNMYFDEKFAKYIHWAYMPHKDLCIN